MSKYRINGGKPLSGNIKISGSKNATFPLIAACLLTDEKCVLTNVPQIKDSQLMLEIISELGVDVNSSGGRVEIQAQGLRRDDPKPDLVSKFRGSIVLVGALLGRLLSAKIPYPGGDKIGARSIDAHVEAFKALGASVTETDSLISFSVDKLTGSKIVLEESSVTATENVLLAAVLAAGTTTIKLAAMEPHIQQLCEFLNKMGAKISGIGSPTLTVFGVDELHGAKIDIIPDSEEAASMITLAAAAKGKLKITDLNPDFLEDYLLRLKKMNVNFKVGPDFVQVLPPSGEYVGTKLQSGLYPKLNSDFVPPMAVLATQAKGETLIYEWLYEDRLAYVAELMNMGAKAEVLDSHQVRIIGPTPLYGQKKITSYDLRMGMTLVIAALVAKGQSEIEGIEHIDRGYANLEERLSKIGADIKRID
ncbi:MAG: UDP-N-acetylglucosamine 1-carboxyvinyltransferase [Candidatus Doudnabacteria bacterium]|nr:UDP-N-acetylglucosamine 1-carboxyvinyltransferase [Candidatus Doudnabacteria bacterium]